MGSTPEAYMLGRDAAESARLDLQHTFYKALCGGRLLHSRTKTKTPFQGQRVRIADVGTGTGAWLFDYAATCTNDSTELVGFDISDAQFPKVVQSPVSLHVHNAATPFPAIWHNYFDVVHIRLVSYAIRAEDIDAFVVNVVRILRPGGYIDWFECDIGDTWSTPASDRSKKLYEYILEERLAAGLPAGFVPRLIGSMTRLRDPEAEDVQPMNGLTNPANAALRILQLETLPTSECSSLVVHANIDSLMLKTGIHFLKQATARRRALAAREVDDDISKEADVIEADVIEAFRTDLEARPLECRYNTTATWIVARKAWPRGDSWTGEQRWG